MVNYNTKLSILDHSKSRCRVDDMLIMRQFIYLWVQQLLLKEILTYWKKQHHILKLNFQVLIVYKRLTQQI